MRIHDLVADGGTGHVLAHRQHRHLLPRREVRHRLHQRLHEEQQRAQRHVLAEGHELDLAVDRSHRAGRVEQHRRVVVAIGTAALDLVGAEQQRHAGGAHEGTNGFALDRVLVEEVGRGRFGPEHDGGAGRRGLARERGVLAADLASHLRIPFVGLRDVRLHEPHDRGRAVARKGRVGDPPRAPGRHGHEQRRRRATERDPVARRAGDRPGHEAALRDQEERHAVNADHAGELCHGQQRDDGAAQRNPRESAQHVPARELPRHPERRGQQQPAGAEPLHRGGHEA